MTTLITRPPIHSEDGNIVSVVATIQDITPLEELDACAPRFSAW